MAIALDVWVCHLAGNCERMGNVIADTFEEAVERARHLASMGRGDTLCLYPPGQTPPTEAQRERAMMLTGTGINRTKAYTQYLTRKQYTAVRASFLAGVSPREIAKKYGITENHVRSIGRSTPRG